MIRTTSIFISVGVTLIAASSILSCTATAQQKKQSKTPAKPAAKAPTFATVKPIFDKNCTLCHGSASAKQGLRLDSYAAIMAGGRGGKCIVAGKSADSSLIKYVLGTMTPRMPAKSAALSKADIDALKAWIDGGAKEK